LVDELGLSGVATVHGRSIVPLGQAYVVDPNVLQAALNEAMRLRPGDLFPAGAGAGRDRGPLASSGDGPGVGWTRTRFASGCSPVSF
jgi:hypothetical protein